MAALSARPSDGCRLAEHPPGCGVLVRRDPADPFRGPTMDFRKIGWRGTELQVPCDSVRSLTDHADIPTAVMSAEERIQPSERELRLSVDTVPELIRSALPDVRMIAKGDLLAPVLEAVCRLLEDGVRPSPFLDSPVGSGWHAASARGSTQHSGKLYPDDRWRCHRPLRWVVWNSRLPWSPLSASRPRQP